MELIKLSKSRARIKVITTEEKQLLEFLYKGGVIKGAYAYKKDSWIEIDFKAYNTGYILFDSKEKKAIPQKDETFGFLK